MSNEELFVIVTTCAAVSSMGTECVKGIFKKHNLKYASNILNIAITIVVAGLCAITYYNGNYTMMFIKWVEIAALTWFTSMFGYDKTKQMLKQMQQLKKNTDAAVKKEKGDRDEKKES